MKTINSETFRECFRNAYSCLYEKKEDVNNLNVFPVPDGDTGTNMSLTLKSAVSNMDQEKAESVGKLSKALSNGALMGARGNSGVILSQLFRGMSQALKGQVSLDKELISKALKEASEVAYKAVMKPTEGTILTVSRALAESAQRNLFLYDDLLDYLRQILEDGKLALSKTPDQLPVLKEAGVVDAGGQGLIIIVEACYRSLLGDRSDIDLDGREDRAEKSIFQEKDIEFGYCTEFLTITDERDEKAYKEEIAPLGDSLIVIKDENIIKTHIHTDHPGRVLEVALKFGYLKDIKIDNMKIQADDKVHENPSWADKKDEDGVDEEEKEFGFIAVAIGQGFKEIFNDLGFDKIIEGGQTMNPSTEDIYRAIEEVNARVCYLFPNNKNIKMSAIQAAQMIEDKEVIVIETKNIPQAINAFFAFDESMSAHENKEAMEEAIEEVSVREITYAVRDSKHDDLEIREGDIIGLVDGDIKVSGKEINKIALDTALFGVERADLITIYRGKEVSEEEGQGLKTSISERFPDSDVDLVYGGQELYYYMISVE